MSSLSSWVRLRGRFIILRGVKTESLSWGGGGGEWAEMGSFV